MQIEIMDIKDLHRAPYNPRIDLMPGDPEYETIKNGLQEYGVVEPLIWNKRTGTLVSGHQRLTALEELGYTQVEVSVVDLDEIQEKQLNVAMNKVTGEWDNPKLSQALAELEEEAKDVGFTPEELEVLENELETYFDNEPEEQDSEDEQEAEEEGYELTLTFYKEDEPDLKAYIKKNGEAAIVDMILDIIAAGPQ